MKYIAGSQLQYTALNTVKTKVKKKDWYALKTGKSVDLGDLKVDELIERNLITKEQNNGN